MPRKKQQNIEATPHPDGFHEGVMNDPAGVQIGINMDTDKTINPAEIAKIKKQSIKSEDNGEQQSNQ